MSLKRFQFVTLAVVAVVTVMLTQSSHCSDSSNQKRLGLHGAVASDSEVCSKIGADVIRDGGTAIDTIATLICLGLIHPHSSGIGGGGYMLLYKRSTKTATYLDFRETAPGASTPDMFVRRSWKSKKGECWRQGGVKVTVHCTYMKNWKH